MAKQPYIQFYLGDYIKDTRVLPLNVKGGWVDLILAMWDNEPKGELHGTIDDYARIMNCSKDEANLVIQTLKQKKIFDYRDDGGGGFTIISRKQKKMVQLSETRKKTGKTGGNPVLLNQTSKELDNQKDKLNTEYEYKDENENKISFEGAGNFSFDSKTALPVFALEAAEMNQFTFTKNKNTDFVKSQWLVFLKERMNDPPEKIRTYRQIQDLTTYFLNWNRNKFPKNGATHQRNNSENGVIKETITTSGGFGKL